MRVQQLLFRGFPSRALERNRPLRVQQQRRRPIIRLSRSCGEERDRSDRVGRQRWGLKVRARRAARALLTRETAMRKMMIAAIAVAGLGLMGASGASAAPLNGAVLDDAAHLAVRRAAETVDLAFEIRLHLQDGVAQHFALDEIIRQLIERPVEVIVEPHIALVSPDHDFAVEAMVTIERETGTLSDQDTVGALAREEMVGDID